jgi:hypothetical protein
MTTLNVMRCFERGSAHSSWIPTPPYTIHRYNYSYRCKHTHAQTTPYPTPTLSTHLTLTNNKIGCVTTMECDILERGLHTAGSLHPYTHHRYNHSPPQTHMHKQPHPTPILHTPHPTNKQGVCHDNIGM